MKLLKPDWVTHTGMNIKGKNGKKEGREIEIKGGKTKREKDIVGVPDLPTTNLNEIVEV